MSNDLVASNGALRVYDRITDPIQYMQTMEKAAASMMGCPAEQGAAIALHCMCEGITIVEMRRKYHWIQGKPSMRADAMLAEFRMNYGGKYEVLKRSADGCEILFIDANKKEYKVGCEWEGEHGIKNSRWPWTDWKDHEKGFKDNWATPTDRENMMFARLVSQSLRWICPELVAGVYTPEELNDAAEPGKQSGRSIEQIMQDEAVKSAQEDVIDAEIVQPAPEPAPAEEPAPTSADPSAPGSIPSRMVESIRELFERIGASPEDQQAILDKRGCKVVHNLSQEAAEELIERLQAKATELGK